MSIASCRVPSIGTTTLNHLKSTSFLPRLTTYSSVSTARWRSLQQSDPFVRLRVNGPTNYRSRSAFKLLDIQQKHKLIQPGNVVVDLGAAPGGWSQVAAGILQGRGAVIAVDLLKMDPIPGVVCVQGDMTSYGMWKRVQQELALSLGDVGDLEQEVADTHQTRLADIVLSDMAHSFTGTSADQLKMLSLVETALEVAHLILKPGGSLVVKFLMCGEINEFRETLKKEFRVVKYEKPAASRKDSKEGYFVAKGYRGPLVS